MQDAVKNYISRVDEVTNLLPVALVVDKTAEVEGTPKTEVVHLFARTRSAPYVYYYRPYDGVKKHWKPWEQMDVEIQYHADPHAGGYLIPEVIGGRLIVFTPQIVSQVREGKPPDNDTPLETLRYFEIKLGWSEYRNGMWTPKRLSSEAIRWTSRESIKLTEAVEGGVGVVRMYLNIDIRNFRFSVGKSGTTGADIDVWLKENIGKFEFRGTSCTVTDNTGWKFDSKERQVSTLADWNTISKHMQDDEKERAKWEFNMELQSPTATSNSWILCVEKSTLKSPKPVAEILLNHESTALLTHTNASATLDDIYNYLQATPSTTSTEAKPLTIPSNELETPFGLYDWELGLHAPMLLMDKLTSSQQYNKALEIARFVFNPMASSEKDSSLLRIWKWGPFKEISGQASDKGIRKVLSELSANTPNDQVNEWRNHPFQPHVVARGRPVAYMTWMVMRYIKILIAAGDQLFRRATMESMPLAIQYYTMAAHLYGPPIQEIPKHTKTTPKTFNTLINQWDAFSNAMVTFENAFPFTNSVGPEEAKDNLGFPMGYFCVPRNPEIRDLRTQIDDRLFKIRHSQDINGATRKLALWEPPIDPGGFVRATAAGLNLSSVMNSISGPMPNYRFQYLLRGALELVQQLKSLAGAFLSAKEKIDSEAYQRIRAGHESTINGMVLDMKKVSRDEANSAIGT